MHKNQDFLHNLCEIAFAHHCEIISKLCAIFTWSVRNFMRNYCTIFMKKKIRLETLPHKNKGYRSSINDHRSSIIDPPLHKVYLICEEDGSKSIFLNRVVRQKFKTKTVSFWGYNLTLINQSINQLINWLIKYF